MTIGNAVGALAFTIAIQQFLKPIHQFRLRAWGVRLRWLFVGVFSGAALVFVGNSLRYAFTAWPPATLLAPVLEVGGGLLFFFAYLATVFISLTTPKLTNRGAPRFARAAFTMLSKANDEDYVALFSDITKNIVPLARLAAFNESYRWAGIDHSEPSAFYDFIHRDKLEQSGYAGTLFRLLSDPQCCKAIVRRDPTSVVLMLGDLSRVPVHSDAVSQLVQELARQAIVEDGSMLAREVGFKGFAAVGAFLNAMFGDRVINKAYEPLRGLMFRSDFDITPGSAERLGAAIELTWEKAGEYWSPQSLWPVQTVLKWALMDFQRQEATEKRRWEYHRLYETVKAVIETTEDQIAKNPRNVGPRLYSEDGKVKAHSTLPALTADIAVDALESMARNFGGHEDGHWGNGLAVFSGLFPWNGEEPDGLTPTQQNAALLIAEKLSMNMEGIYPPLTRVLLALIGPHNSHHQKNRTAFRILEDVAYREWQKLPALQKEIGEKIADFLPPYVKYDPEANTLTHTYSGGSQRTTNLSDLVLPVIDLTDKALRRQ